jgi:hypothetical protein
MSDACDLILPYHLEFYSDPSVALKITIGDSIVSINQQINFFLVMFVSQAHNI